MECHIRVFFRGNQLLSPSSLVTTAEHNSILPLTFSSPSGDYIDALFVRVKDLPLGYSRVDLLFYVAHLHHTYLRRNLAILKKQLLVQKVIVSVLTSRIKRDAKTKANMLPKYYSEFNDGKWRYVELALVADYSVYAKYDKDEGKVNEYLQTIAHHVNALYYPLNIRITLVWIDIWKDGDKFEIATSGDRTLDRFLNYRKEIIKTHPNDNAHLLTDIRFESNVVGKAFKGTMCSYDYSGGVDVDHSNNAAIVAATVAHEMGHNFGMEHDVDYGTTCNCPGNQCVMAPSTGASPPSFWSDCSLRYLYNSFNRGMDLCLKNPPEKAVGDAKCGNGIVETGELHNNSHKNNAECDCGGELCLHSCCDGKTCLLTSEAECADGDCCDLLTCKPKPRATVCRESVGICDLPEFCNGDTPDCPADFFLQNGHICPGRTNEFCYEGQCGSRPDQCVSLWGTTATEGDEACYQQNVNGIMQGNCGYDVHAARYTQCLAEFVDVMCGRLQCGTQAERPIFGDPTTVLSAYTYVRVGADIHQCHVIRTTYVVEKKNKLDPGMVLDGSKCGNDKICVNAKCKPLNEVLKTVSKCNDQCHYRGVCNNVGNCHCQNGFGGIACEIPGFGGSVNSNPSNTSRGKRRNLPGEFWNYARKTLNLYGVLVPVRKAPPPPGERRHIKRESLNTMWGDGVVNYSVNERPPSLAPPAIPLMSINPISPQTKSHDRLLAHFPVVSSTSPGYKATFARVPSMRPKEPPPVVPSRPHDSRIEELYKEKGVEMGIKRYTCAPTDFASRDLPPSPPPDDPGVSAKKDVSRPLQPPPLPPPKHQKHSLKHDTASRPPLPQKPPEITDGTELGVGVRELAAKFDSQRQTT
ncbi:Disintegrin [Dictyocaulus viviparus]|uniref:Disintegrin n=1 Tax=Dictyocaulus viviparus TaxID=29172 RepID=A0A0D8XP15_DICVI|nr:Disintegrin [Dictyocaulus viviparus]